MNPRALGLIALAALLAPASALAQDPAPATTTQPPVTTTTPAAPVVDQVSATFSLTPEKVGPSRAVLAGRRFRVRGVMQPYVAGQFATVRYYLGGRKIAVKRLTLLPSSTGKSGYFLTGITVHSPGRVTITASHRSTPELATAVADPVNVDVLPLRVLPGSTGRAVRLLQARLRALHYVVGQAGVMDARTSRAVMAFRKLNDMQRTESADSAFFKRLPGGRGFAVRYPDQGRHVEADLTHQVLALIGAGGHVERIYPISSGKPSTPTVLGNFHVYSKTPGTNAKGMVYANYFIGGYAIHGYAEVPPYAASHGCLRVPVPDAVPIYNWVQYGTPVDVYYR